MLRRRDKEPNTRSRSTLRYELNPSISTAHLDGGAQQQHLWAKGHIFTTKNPMDYLDPLPQQVAKVTALSSASNAINLNNIDSIIERLESARNSVASGSGLGPGSRANTALVSVHTFVKSGNVKAATAHKDWASAVGKLSKDVDKVSTLIHFNMYHIAQDLPV